MKKYDSFINTGLAASIQNNDPIYNINEKEFDRSLLKFGALVSMLQNKRINQTNLLILLIEVPEYLKCFQMISDVDNPQMLIYNYIMRYPILCKSKTISQKLNQLFKYE